MMTEPQKMIVKIDKDVAKKIDAVERKKLFDSYLKLYSGFAWVNWTNKQSLGRAWQTALVQCEEFLKNKNQNNPVTKHLKNVASAHKATWSRVIMTNKNSPNTLNKSPEEIQQLQQHGKKQIREAMDIINLISAKHLAHTEELNKPNEQSVAKSAPEKTVQKPLAQKIAPEQMEKTVQKSAAQRLDAQKAAGNQSEKVIKRPVPANAKPIVQKPKEQTGQPVVKQPIEKQNATDAQRIVQQRMKLFMMMHYNQKVA